MYPLIGVPMGWELVLIVLVVVLLFGAKKLPELARGSGQALRIFKSETKGMRGDDETDDDTVDDSTAKREPGEIQSSRGNEGPRLGEERNDGTTA